MKLCDLLKVVDASDLICVKNEDLKEIAVFERGDFVDRDRDGVVFVREENNDPSWLDKEVLCVYVAVIDSFGLPGLNVIVK